MSDNVVSGSAAPPLNDDAPPVVPTDSRSAIWQRLPAGALLAVVLLVVGIWLPFALSAGNLHLAVSILIVAIAAVGLDVLIGRTGQISLGHAFFLGVGAYTAGKLGTDHNLDWIVVLLAAGVISGVIGGLVGPTALRLRGLYLAIVTISLVFIGTNVFTDATVISGGPGGRQIAPPHFWGLHFTLGTAPAVTVGGLTFSGDGCYYYLSLIVLVLTMLFVRNLGASRVGRNMAAVRDRELAAAVLGVNVARTKITAFVISSAITGVAGAIYGSFQSFVNPTDWSLLLSIQFVIIIVIGGLGSTYGPLLGSIFVIGLPQLLQNYAGSLPFIQNGSGTGSGIAPSDASTLLFAVLLVVFLIVEPRGLVGWGTRLGRLVGLRLYNNEGQHREG